MKRPYVFAIALSFVIGGCSHSSPSTPSTPAKPTFTANLRPANEVPPISNPESTGSGMATITLDVTKDTGGNVTSATATFVVTLTGFPPGTPINIGHIHQAVAGQNGAIVVSTGLAAGEVVLASGSGSFTKSGVAISPVDIANQMLTNPAGFYFNVHSTLNPGGVARDQLLRTQ